MSDELEETTTPEATPPEPEPTPEQRTYTDGDVERIVKERLERQRRKLDADAQKAADAAKQAALAEQGEYKRLYEEAQTRLAEHEAVATAAERYQVALTSVLEQQRKGLPDYLVPLLDKMDVAEQLEYLAKNAYKLKPTPAPNLNGAGGKPAANPQEREVEIRRRFRL